MYDSEKKLHSISRLWRNHSSKTMSKDQGEAFHTGAVKFYKEVGNWRR